MESSTHSFGLIVYIPTIAKMNPLLKLFVAFCLVSFALSRPFPEGDEEAADGEEDAGGEDAGGEDAGDEGAGEGGEGEGDDAGGDDAGGDDAGGDDAGGDNAGGKGEGKDDRVNTYNKVTEQLDKATKVDNIQSEYLRPALDNELQAGLRNPVIEAIGTIGDYSKISSCFDSMDSDVKKILDQETKSFDDCKSKKDASEYTCSEESSKKAKEEFKQIGSKIVSCVSSKGN